MAQHSVVSIQQHVPVGGVCAVVFALKVPVKASKFFPFDDGHGRVQGVQVCHLDIGGINVLLRGARKGNPPLVDVLSLVRRAGRNAKDAAKRAIHEFETHAGVNEGYAEILEFLNKKLLGFTTIHAEESEGDTVKEMQIRRVQGYGVGDDSVVHFRIDALEEIDFLGCLAQFVK
jgi:hypothetical protein